MESKMKTVLKEDYSDEELMDAILIFSHILWNRYNKSGKATLEWAEEFWNELYAFVKKWTWLDTKKFYK